MPPVLDSARDRGREVVERGAALARTTVQQARGAVTRGRDITRQTTRALAEHAGPELALSAARLRRVRKPSDAIGVFEAEVEHLLRVLAPVLVENPLPIRDPAAARVVVATVAAGAATAEEAEEISLLFSGGASAPGLPSVIALAFVALAVEVHVAVSLRVHALEDAGLPVDPDRVAYDVAAAMVGSKPFAGPFVVTRAMVKGVARRVLRRWGAGLVPVIGIAYSAWNSQATITAIASMPLVPADPPELPAGSPTNALAH
jgi:hypothetical protein